MTFDPALIKSLVRESRAAQGLPPTITDAGFHRRALAIVDRAHEARAREAASELKAA